MFSTELRGQLHNLPLVFQKLIDARLKIQLHKCEFLGHIITTDGIRANPKKYRLLEYFLAYLLKEKLNRSRIRKVL